MVLLSLALLKLLDQESKRPRYVPPNRSVHSLFECLCHKLKPSWALWDVFGALWVPSIIESTFLVKAGFRQAPPQTQGLLAVEAATDPKPG